MPGVTILAEVAHQMGLLPLAWVALRRSREMAYWWLALAFGVSWLADTAAHWFDPMAIALVYSVSQAALIGSVFLTRRDALGFLTTLAVVGVAASFWERGTVLMVSISHLGIVGIVYDRWALGHLRTALLVSFGLGLLAWWAYAAHPAWGTWLIYQGVRALGIAWFMYAVTQKPALKLA